MAAQGFEVDIPTKYSHELAAEVGRLHPYLADRFTGEPADEGALRSIIEEPSSDLVTVRSAAGLLVATSSLTLIRNTLGGAHSYLEGVVSHPDVRGSGVADLMADEWESWNRLRGSGTMRFTSGWHREEAHRFYQRRGAYIVNEASRGIGTAHFEYPI